MYSSIGLLVPQDFVKIHKNKTIYDINNNNTDKGNEINSNDA